jgi:sec-independent protein translocase protein TatA
MAAKEAPGMPFIGGGHFWIILLVLAIILIIYGPGKLPEVGGAIGRGIREFRKASTDLTDEIKKSGQSSPTAEQAPSPSSDVKPPTDSKV